MTTQTQELIKTERRRADFRFITEVEQQGKICPAKFKYSFTLAVSDFESMRDKGMIEPEYLIIENSAFFKFIGDEVKISFLCQGVWHDFIERACHFKLVEQMGYFPFKIGVASKMNFDKKR